MSRSSKYLAKLNMYFYLLNYFLITLETYTCAIFLTMSFLKSGHYENSLKEIVFTLLSERNVLPFDRNNVF